MTPPAKGIMFQTETTLVANEYFSFSRTGDRTNQQDMANTLFSCQKKKKKLNKKYEVLRNIGKGSFSKVKLVQDIENNEIYAAKYFDKKIYSKQVNYCEREAAVLRLLNHPNIVTFHELIIKPSLFVLVCEFVNGVDMYTFMVEKDCLREDAAHHIFRQLVDGIRYMHSMNFVHRDLKLENIMIDREKLTVKLIDFGFSKSFIPGVNMWSFCGSTAYAAPEVLKHERYDGRKSDIWSLGVILFVLNLGCFPFPPDTGFISTFFSPSIFKRRGFSKNLEALITRMLEPCPLARLNIDAVFREPWVVFGAPSRRPRRVVPKRRFSK